jgi:hypothetical protein
MAGEPTDSHLTGSRPFSQVDKAEASGFSRPGMTGKEDELPLGDMEVHVFQSGPGPGVGLGDA